MASTSQTYPLPDRIYKIRDISYNQILTAYGNDVKLAPDQNAPYQEWICEKAPTGTGFRNSDTDCWLGVNSDGYICDTATQQGYWESFVFQEVTTGGYQMIVIFNNTANAMIREEEANFLQAVPDLTNIYALQVEEVGRKVRLANEKVTS